MIIDGHTHIFPEEIQKNRKRFFSQEPNFTLLYNDKKSKLIGAEQLIEKMDETGVNKSVVFGFPFENPLYCRKCNDYILEAMQKFSGRIIGFCCVHPLSKDFAIEEVQRCLKAGMRGIGELAFYSEGFTENVINALAPIATLAREYHVPITIHTNEPVGHYYPGKSPMGLKQMYELIKRYQENILIMAHWGGGFFFYELMKKGMAEITSQVYYDTAASPFLYNAKIYSSAIDIIGPDRIIYGSDYPLLDLGRYRKELEESNISKEEREKILGKNLSLLIRD
ncbi:MAG: amidohydrolase family protein [bacterium]